jgi:hypothetical protein
MKMKPVAMRNIKSPAYPTRRDFLAGATAFAAATFAGGWRIFAADPASGGFGGGAMPQNAAPRAILACVAMMPPVYHSEEEAMTIIREELSKAGVQLNKNVMLNNVLLPQPVNKSSNANVQLAQLIQQIQSQGKNIESNAIEQLQNTLQDTLSQFENRGNAFSEPARATKSISVSGMDPSKNIAVEFTTPSKFKNIAGDLGCANRMNNCSYQFITLDVRPKPGSQAGDKVYLGVFRDPTEKQSQVGGGYAISPSPNGLPSSSNKMTPEQSNDIRRQVQVFVSWLKEQKAL